MRTTNVLPGSAFLACVEAQRGVAILTQKGDFGQVKATLAVAAHEQPIVVVVTKRHPAAYALPTALYRREGQGGFNIALSDRSLR